MLNGVVVGIDTNQINCSHLKRLSEIVTLEDFDSISTTQFDCSLNTEENEPPLSEVQPQIIDQSLIQTTVKTIDSVEKNTK